MIRGETYSPVLETKDRQTGQAVDAAYTSKASWALKSYPNESDTYVIDPVDASEVDGNWATPPIMIDVEPGVYTAEWEITLDSEGALYRGVQKRQYLLSVEPRVVVSPLPTISLVVTPSSITEGDSATLSWTSANASSVSIDQGIGAVALNDSLVVSPVVTTAYKATAIGTGYTVFSNTTLTVTPPVVLGFKFFRLTFEHLTTEAVNQFIQLDSIKLSDASGIITPQGMNDAGQPTGPGVPHVEDGWTITASNEHIAYPGWRCFYTQIPGLEIPWITPNNTTVLPLTLDMSSASSYSLVKYKLIRTSWARTRSPKTWTLHGSDTGAFAGEETLLHTVTDFVWSTDAQEWTL